MSELLEKILSKDNMNAAYKRVCANKGAGGVDEVTIEELGDYIKENWESIRNQTRGREYKPQPVRRVEIPKPDGGVRKLGIPTVMDRVIQQGIVQVISPMCEPLFSEWSYGFRPNRSCEMAIRQLQQSYTVLVLLISNPNLEDISFTKSSYASGEMYVLNNSDTPIAQTTRPDV